jgi:histidinol dehydrogenase
MEIIKYPERNSWSQILKRPVLETQSLDETVRSVMYDVRDNGDAAVRKYTEKFDKAILNSIEVSEEEKRIALSLIDKNLVNAIKLASDNITKFHLAQIPKEIKVETVEGVECWQKPVAIEKVGLYIPGGTAPLFSTVLMLAIPARIAGCSEIALCSPPDKSGNLNPAIIYAANVAGINRIFKIGGVQAIAAMTFGTDTVPKVYKIFGPGNQYVTAAKQFATREGIAIDMPAGPSEVAVLADDSSNPVFVASDLLSQAEHGADSQVILISVSEKLIAKTMQEVKRQLELLPRNEFAAKSLSHSKAFLVNDFKEMMELSNAYAPEHLIISTSNADELATGVINAGSVFIGEYTPESAGDYASGTNHTLPTHGYATAYSGVNMDAYYKKITFQKISKKGLEIIGPVIEKMALTEDLTAHKRAVSLRLRNEF